MYVYFIIKLGNYLLIYYFQVNDLVARQVQNLKSGVVSKQQYSQELRSFALTLHYYSPKAYEYVRSTFNSCLPHPQTLKKWYANIGGEPGFTKESFLALKLKADSASHPLLATLVIDEMAIRRRVEWDGQKLHGYVDFGTGLNGDHLEEAKEVLVFLITAINNSFKVPVAFFLVDGVSGIQRSELVKQCIERVHEVGIKVVALTFDGCAANVSMARHLGCSFTNGNVKFEHPMTKEPIVVILDPCHMIKLLRNAFQTYKTFVDKDGKQVKWQYLIELNKIQEDERFHLSNKLRFRHINFQNQRMKVKLATQLFSSSVAEAMKFCRKDLQIDAFKESEATEKFIILINNIFDIFNSRNLHQYGFKKAINERNAAEIFDYLNIACEYLSHLSQEDGTLLTASSRKIGFLGFIGCAEALKHLYTSLIQEKIIIYLPFYKLSQDHLELLFGNIRAHGGSNNNPTARQFVAAYKKLLVHIELKNFGSGNCIELEHLSILNCSSAVERINKTTGLDLRNEDWIEDHTEEQEVGELLSNISEFSSQAIAHIAGYIARILIKKLNCDVCAGALVTRQINSLHKFIVAKDKGGLVYPSHDIIRICKVAEAVIRSMDGRVFKKEVIIMKILRKFVGEKLFENIHFHQIRQFPTSNHISDLIKAISERYVNVRLHHLLKLNIKLTKRQLLNKYVLFQGH